MMTINIEMMIMLLLFFWLLGLSISDVRYRSVPVWMLLLGVIPAVGMGVYGSVQGESSLPAFLLGMLPGMVLLLLALGTRKAGWADGIVLMILGGGLGLRQCILAAMFSLILLSALSAVLLVLRKVDKGTAIPYVPFLTMGFVLCEMMGG